MTVTKPLQSMLFTLSHVVSSSRLLVNFLTSLSSSASSLRSQTPNCSVQSESCGTQVFHHRNPHNVWTTTVTNLIFSFSIRPLVRSVFGRVDGFYVLSLRPPHRELQYSTPYAHSAPQYLVLHLGTKSPQQRQRTHSVEIYGTGRRKQN